MCKSFTHDASLLQTSGLTATRRKGLIYMKSVYKRLAVAAIAFLAAGAAHADIVTNRTNNGSLVIGAFNTVTRDWYLRDTGLTLNQFLPSNVTTLPGDGAVTGDKTPAAGLLLDRNTVAGFADASFATWYGAQTAANVRWFVSAVDDIGTSTVNNVKRFVASSADPYQAANNAKVDQYVSSGNAGGLSAYFGSPGPGTVSVTGFAAGSPFDTNFGLGSASLAAVGSDAGLYYAARTAGVGSTATSLPLNNYNGATINLAANGDFTFVAPAAVPVPAAAWLLVSGLTAIGGAARRRKGRADTLVRPYEFPPAVRLQRLQYRTPQIRMNFLHKPSVMKLE
jgi:hypothetical protein